MGAIKLGTVKQKLWAIVAASFVARVITFFALPNTPTALAPDEGTYSALAKWIAESKPASEFPGFSDGLYLSSRSTIIPASVLTRFGLDELDSVRLTSSVYGFLSVCLVAMLCVKICQSSSFDAREKKKLEALILIILLVYAFLPSHFLWSNLGLRESTNEFWLLMTFTGVFLLFRTHQKYKIYLAIFIALSILCTFSTRPQAGWVLVASLLVYSLFKLKLKITYLLIASIAAGLISGYLATTSKLYVTTEVYVAQDSISTSRSQEELMASKLCNGTQNKVMFREKEYRCEKSGSTVKRVRSSNLAEVAVNQVEVLPDKQLVNQVGAASKIERLNCPWSESSEAGKYACLAFRAPFMSLTFLFRPFLIFDTTSAASMLAATENIIWVFFFVFIIYRIAKYKRINFFQELAPSLVFLTLFVVGAGSYEGNMGTAFRHKSLVLWIVLLLLFAVFWCGQDEAKESLRNNSQESAV